MKTLFFRIGPSDFFLRDAMKPCMHTRKNEDGRRGQTRCLQEPWKAGRLKKQVSIRVARWFIFKPNLGKFRRALDGKMLIYWTAIWNILQLFGIFSDHLVHFVFIWYIFSGFGIMYQRKIWQPCCPLSLNLKVGSTWAIFHSMKNSTFQWTMRNLAQSIS
jgi:hypothetical protein